MKYLLDQEEYDRMTGKYVGHEEWLDRMIEDFKFKAFCNQGNTQEKHLIRALQSLIKAKESLNGSEI